VHFPDLIGTHENPPSSPWLYHEGSTRTRNQQMPALQIEIDVTPEWFCKMREELAQILAQREAILKIMQA
jgi:hypothetical protein